MSPFLFIYYTMFLIFKKEKVSISEYSYQHTPEEKEKPRGQSFRTNQQGFKIKLSINVLYGYALCLYEQLLQLVHQQR